MPVSTACAQDGSLPSSARTTSGAASMPSRTTGNSTTTVHDSSALAVREAPSRSPVATAPASTGTTTEASAPPATTSKTTLGTALTAE